MKLYYAVKDLAVNAFGNPFLVRSKGEAMRSFQDEVNRTDGQSAVAQHPEDYELYEIGTYNDNTGNLTPARDEKGNKTPLLIARAKDLLTPRS